MATLTLDVPDTVAQTVALLSESERAAFIAHMNAVAVAALQNEEADKEDLSTDLRFTYPLPPFLQQPLADDLREAFADIQAGRVIDGETFLADLRRRAERG